MPSYARILRRLFCRHRRNPRNFIQCWVSCLPVGGPLLTRQENDYRLVVGGWTTRREGCRIPAVFRVRVLTFSSSRPRRSIPKMTVQPPISTIHCNSLYSLANLVLPSPMFSPSSRPLTALSPDFSYRSAFSPCAFSSGSPFKYSPPSLSNLFRIRTYEKLVRNPFRIRTYKTQDLKPFRMNTYKKTGGVGSLWLTCGRSPLPHASVLVSLHLYSGNSRSVTPKSVEVISWH